ncbi:HU family DNA-binding protein [Microvirga sp. BT689]|nr:HU family DNA-binding protein [Microvirga arvi]MBM6584343.1 HU family DNA-binding protein [Microvirga arvi]
MNAENVKLSSFGTVIVREKGRRSGRDPKIKATSPSNTARSSV